MKQYQLNIDRGGTLSAKFRLRSLAELKKLRSDSRWSSLGFFDSEENALHFIAEFGVIMFQQRIKKATTEETEQALRPLFKKSSPKPTGKIIQVRAELDPPGNIKEGDLVLTQAT